MYKTKRKKFIVRFIIHVLFVLGLLLFFRYNSVLRPAAMSAPNKEFVAALILLLMLYTNYLLIIPRFFFKRKFVIFLVLSLTSVFLATFFEMFLVLPHIKYCYSNTNGLTINSLIILHSFLVGGRNMAFLLFFFVLRIFENEKHTLKKERIALAKNKGFICVPNGKYNMKTISISDISHILHEKNYTYIHTIDGSRYCKYCSLSNIAELLPENLFFRINRNAIIPLNRITGYSQNSVTMLYGNPAQEMTFPLSENYVPNIKEILATFGGLNRSGDGLNNLSDGLNNRVDMNNLEEFLTKIENNEELLTLCRIIAKEPSVTMKNLSDQLQVSPKTVERRLKILKDKGILKHCGAKKNGAYVFTPSIPDSVINWLTTDLPAYSVVCEENDSAAT